jgi:hypothetical protein
MKHFCKSSFDVRLWGLDSGLFLPFLRGASVRLGCLLKGMPLIPAILGAIFCVGFMSATSVRAQNNGCTASTNIGCGTAAALTLLPPAPDTNVVCLGSPISMGATISNTPGTLVHTVTNEDCSTTNWSTSYNCGILSEGWAASDTSGFTTNGTGLNATFTPPNCGHGIITFTVTYNSAPCDTSTQTAQVTGIYDAVTLQSVSVANATPLDPTNWAAVKTAGTNTNYVVVTANICPDIPEATNVISITGGEAVSSNVFQRQVPGWEVGMTTITITGCTNTNIVNVWIVWGTWTEFNNTGPKDSDSTVDPVMYGATNSWVVDDPTDGELTWFKNGALMQCTIYPTNFIMFAGVGYDIQRTKERNAWIETNGNPWYPVAGEYFPPGSPDGPQAANKDTTPSASAHIYSTDLPGPKMHLYHVSDLLVYRASFVETAYIILPGAASEQVFSDGYQWHSISSVVWNGTNYQRTDGSNEISTGAITVGTNSSPP